MVTECCKCDLSPLYIFRTSLRMPFLNNRDSRLKKMQSQEPSFLYSTIYPCGYSLAAGYTWSSGFVGELQFIHSPQCWERLFSVIFQLLFVCYFFNFDNCRGSYSYNKFLPLQSCMFYFHDWTLIAILIGIRIGSRRTEH